MLNDIKMGVLSCAGDVEYTKTVLQRCEDVLAFIWDFFDDYDEYTAAKYTAQEIVKDLYKHEGLVYSLHKLIQEQKERLDGVLKNLTEIADRQEALT